MAVGTLTGNEPEIIHKVKGHHLDIIGLVFTYSSGFKANLLNRQRELLGMSVTETYFKCHLWRSSDNMPGETLSLRGLVLHLHQAYVC